MKTSKAWLATALILAWTSAGCGSDGGGSDEDTSTDTSDPDVLMDTEEDPTLDTADDTDEDVPLDAHIDTEDDSPEDVIEEEGPEICTSDGDCDDEVFCNGAEVCHLAGYCVSDTGFSCDDEDPCTVDSCDETAGACINDSLDGDGDGFPAATGPGGEDCDGTDCNDGDDTVHPGAPEDQCDLIDSDCDGSNAEYIDDDGDGWIDGDCTGLPDTPAYHGDGDCNDDPAAGGAGFYPGATELCNNEDDDCDGSVDGFSQPCGSDVGECAFGTETCTAGSWGACTGGVDPAAETCNNLDDDCDTLTDEDLTQTCGSDVGECVSGTETCTAGSWSACSGEVGPTTEICDEDDNDCDGLTDEGVLSTFYLDSDTDGYGDMATTTTGCSIPPGYAISGTDCNDSNASVNPGASELCDGLDTNCDEGGGARAVEDADGDGHATMDTTICIGGPLPGDDCDDLEPDVHPGQTAYFDTPYCPGSLWLSTSGDSCCEAYSPTTCVVSATAPSYDYNCDGTPESEANVYGTACMYFTGICVGSGPYFTGPALCGDSVTHRYCFYSTITHNCQSSLMSEPLACR